MNQFTKIIAAQLKLREQAVENTLELLEEGCTIPFISRYRKEKTGNMDEVNIEAIAQANEKLKEMAKRKETILKTIDEQGKLTDALKERIETVGMPQNWKISIFLSSLSAELVHRLHVRLAWNRWLRCSSSSVNATRCRLLRSLWATR